MARTDRPAAISGERVLIYDRISANKRRTWLVMLLFVALLGGFATLVGYIVGMPLWAIPVIFAGLLIWALFSYYASSSIALSVSGAHPVTKEEEPELYRVVENLSIGTGLPMPKVYVIEDGSPNAFATGRDPEHASVAATRGLLDKLEKSELEGVMAHEISHVGNYDIRVMTITVVLVGLVALLADVFLRWTWFGTGRRTSNRGRGGGGAYIVLLLIAIALAILAPFVARVIQMAVSREREYLADASGALLTRNPDALARALEKISRDPDPLEAANKATEHLYFNNPLTEHRSFLNSLFSSHPPVEERIRLLRSM